MNNSIAIYPNIYPWQKSVWQQFNLSRQRLPHAILLHGRAGIGKFQFAQTLSQSLLCLAPTTEGHACQQCQSCHWFKDGAHPDLRLLSPEQDETEAESDTAKKTKKKTTISIAQVRDLNDFINLSSHQQKGLRIILIHPAEALNNASANALLKMLEEPANNVIFLLVSHQLHRLLPTILSRCHKVTMPVPDEASSIAWLNTQNILEAQSPYAYFSGAPIHVAEQMEVYSQLTDVWNAFAQGEKLDPAATAAKLTANSAELGVNSLQKWLYDLLATKSGCQIRYHLAYAKTLQQLASKVNLTALLALQKKTLALKSLALHPLNHALQMECLLLDYKNIF